MKHKNVDLHCLNYPNWYNLCHPGFLQVNYKDFYGYKVPSQTEEHTISLLLEEVKTIHNGKIVEIGVFGGWVSLHLAEAALKTNSKVYSIDVWEKLEVGNGNEFPEHQLLAARYYMEQIRLNYENILDELEYSNATVICESSLTAVNQFEDKSIDLIFIDGEHHKDHLYKELVLWYPKLKEGGSLYGDDYNWDGLSDSILKFARENNLECYTDGRIWNLK
jgi:predicted O-methyltransferase YrrM